MVARTEAILLDPVYSGKAMSGMIDLIRKDYFPKGRQRALPAYRRFSGPVRLPAHLPLAGSRVPC